MKIISRRCCSGIFHCLDTKNQRTSINVCHIGSLNDSPVYPREVMKPAILFDAASILVVPNHQSGQVPEPSQEDINVIKQKRGESWELIYSITW